MEAVGLSGMSGALSRRELEVLAYIKLGFTNRQIAGRLGVSTNTVNKHVQQVLRKLEVSNRVQAATSAHPRVEPLALGMLSGPA